MVALPRKNYSLRIIGRTFSDVPQHRGLNHQYNINELFIVKEIPGEKNGWKGHSFGRTVEKLYTAVPHLDA